MDDTHRTAARWWIRLSYPHPQQYCGDDSPSWEDDDDTSSNNQNTPSKNILSWCANPNLTSSSSSSSRPPPFPTTTPIQHLGRHCIFNSHMSNTQFYHPVVDSPMMTIEQLLLQQLLLHNEPPTSLPCTNYLACKYCHTPVVRLQQQQQHQEQQQRTPPHPNDPTNTTTIRQPPTTNHTKHIPSATEPNVTPSSLPTQQQPTNVHGIVSLPRDISMNYMII